MVVDLARNEGYNMGRYIGAVCKRCRREGVKLHLKGERCNSGKCCIEKARSGQDKDKRPNPPGMHNWRKGKLSDYGVRFREKQKVKRYYGVYERQFKNYFALATKQKGNSGTNLLVLLERRLDNVVCRGSLAASRAQARQFINHGHIAVNGKKMDIPSYLVKEGDVISYVNHEASQKMIQTVYESLAAREIPSWILKTPDKAEIKVTHMPVRNEVALELNEQYIVEFCAR